jgi:fermentation-respiration switch protein FrsA (DUF1100 family)
MVNGAEDQLIPPSQGKKLFALANQPKEYRAIQGRGHNDSFDQFAPLSLDWIGRVCRPG